VAAGILTTLKKAAAGAGRTVPIRGACGGEFHCGAGCHCSGPQFQRRFKTKDERIAEPESYLSELRKDVQAVEEMLADLRK